MLHVVRSDQVGPAARCCACAAFAAVYDVEIHQQGSLHILVYWFCHCTDLNGDMVLATEDGLKLLVGWTLFPCPAATFSSAASYNYQCVHVLLQVFSVFMHLQYAAKNKADAQADSGQHSAKLQEMCTAAEAVTEAELLQLGLPVLRSVSCCSSN